MSAHLLVHLFMPRESSIETRRGYVADFCVVCRDLRAFSLMEMDSKRTVAGMRTRGDEVLGHYIRCMKCGAELASTDMRYSFVAEEIQPDFELLIATTYPVLRKKHAARLELEGDLRRGKTRLALEERRKLLIEPLIALSSMVDRRFAEPNRIDARMSLACGGTLLITIALFCIGEFYLQGAAQTWALRLMGMGLAFGIGYSLLAMTDAPLRFVKIRVAPLAGRALKPLGPGRKEIEECLEECRRMELKIGTALKLDWLWTNLR
jgi:hypothetical protein